MLKIKIISIGKGKDTSLSDAVSEYLNRLTGRAKAKSVELDNAKFTQLPVAEQQAKEAALLIKELSSSDYLIVLDQRGKQLSSEQFATQLQTLMNSGRSQLVFAIGGSHGWDDTIRSRADMLLSLSNMTLTYQMARLFIAEQLYRAFSILNGTSYHK